MIATPVEKEQNAGRGGVIFTPADASGAEVTISAELRRGLGAREADRRLAAGNRAGDMGARIVSFYLVDLADRGGHQEFGFHSVLDYAETRFGIQRRTAREYMAVERALSELPLIDEALCEGRLFWSHGIDCVHARAATPTTDREHYYRGIAYEGLLQLEQARREFGEALRLNPDSESTRSALDRVESAL